MAVARWIALGAVGLLAACQQPECGGNPKIDVYQDLDGDGWGGDPDGQACEPAWNQSDRTGDCNDQTAHQNPDMPELCNGIDDNCNGALDEGLPGDTVFYADVDADGYGDPGAVLAACHAPPGYVHDGTDCADADASVHPGAVEVCDDGVDDDCNGLADDADPAVDPDSFTAWSADADGDGFGNAGGAQLACAAPEGAVADQSDCDDGHITIHPGAAEVCDQVDNDCDGLVDDLDPDIDTSGMVPLFADVDGDGSGDPGAPVTACKPHPGLAVEDSSDCDDANAAVNPRADEILCTAIDEDCDPLTPDDGDRDGDGFTSCGGDCDDRDPAIHPGAAEIFADQVDQDCDGLEDCYADVDLDGSRSDVVVHVTDGFCRLPGDLPPDALLDCDDADASVTWSGDWVADSDLDGYGAGPVVLHQCADPGPGFTLAESEPDCADADPTAFPGGTDLACNDGVDGDCDGADLCATCAEWQASDPALHSGVYGIDVDGRGPFDVWCDLDTDGGGWTLVGSSAGAPLDDARARYYADLSTLVPTAAHAGIWDGLRDVAGTADVRFACKLAAADQDLAVDLSFYGVDWYATMIAGSDADSCFSPPGDPASPPGRRDNRTGMTLPPGDPWNGGALVGEDACDDVNDFTVDFDDRGMDGDEADGTDWGEDDGKEKCGVAGQGDAWFVFVREVAP